MDERKFIFQLGQRLKRNCVFVWSEDEYTNYIRDTDNICKNIICLMNNNFEIIRMSCIDEDSMKQDSNTNSDNTEPANGGIDGDGEVDDDF